VNCRETAPLLDPYFDGELDLTTALRVEEHLADCGVCDRHFQNLKELRREIADAAIDFAPTPALARRIAGRVRPQSRRSVPIFAAAAAALALLLVFSPRLLRTDANAQELLDTHLRSLMTAHLVDVPSSDRHTVKPWFQGRLRFSPNVPDLSAEGFVLVGGRLEVVRRAPAAALVYRRREHVINVFVAPENGPYTSPRTFSREGYNLVEWSKDGLSYSAVSDLNAAELRQFSDLAQK
jgi:anti-sigma factor RsiW